MDAFHRLRSSRSETNLRRKPTAPAAAAPPVPAPPASTFPLGFGRSQLPKQPTPTQSHSAYNDGGRGLGIRISPRPGEGRDVGEEVFVDAGDSWNDAYSTRFVKPEPPLPLRIPSRGAPPVPQVRPQAQPLQQHPLQGRMQNPASADDVPGLSPSLRARPGALMSRSRPTTPVSTPSPLTPSSTDDFFGPTTTTGSGLSGTTMAAEQEAAKKKGLFKTAFDGTVYFAGGLISHPAESENHFSILRHSGPIIMYQGPETSVAISIFATEPLPRDRTLWLQQRGLSGDRGMRFKLLVGATSGLRNVTPDERRELKQVSESDERGWQRDAAKFLKKSKKQGGKIARHVWRETLIARIPADIEDGYFRMVLQCGRGSEGDPADGRRTLCGSPIFRIASASKDASVLGGASVSTLPLEVGLKTASKVAEVYATKYTKPVTMVAGAAQGTVVKAVGGAVEKKVGAQKTVAITSFGKRVIAQSGIEGEIRGAGERHAAARGDRYNALGHGPTVHGENTVGPDDGPAAPFPLKFSGKVVPGTGRSTRELGLPTANLDDVPQEMRMRLKGVYFGWVRVGSRQADVENKDWRGAIISVGTLATASVAPRPVIVVHVVHHVAPLGSYEPHSVPPLFNDTDATALLGKRLEIMVMGWLRPRLVRDIPVEEHLKTIGIDYELTADSLGRTGWVPNLARDQLKAVKRSRTIGDNIVVIRDKAQMQVDRIPLHRIGVRTEAAILMEPMQDNGGFWIAR